MRFYVLPQLRERGVDTITTSDVLAVLTPLWSNKHPTAMRVLQRISAVCRWAIAEGHRTDDPTANVTSVLPNCNGAEKHHEAMPYAQVGAFLPRLGTGAGPQAARLALEFLILTATRTSEVRLMTWNEVDWDGCTWTIPAVRMKMMREHQVPLSDRAMAILNEARALAIVSDDVPWLDPFRLARSLGCSEHAQSGNRQIPRSPSTTCERGARGEPRSRHVARLGGVCAVLACPAPLRSAHEALGRPPDPGLRPACPGSRRRLDPGGSARRRGVGALDNLLEDGVEVETRASGAPSGGVGPACPVIGPSSTRPEGGAAKHCPAWGHWRRSGARIICLAMIFA